MGATYIFLIRAHTKWYSSDTGDDWGETDEATYKAKRKEPKKWDTKKVKEDSKLAQEVRRKVAGEYLFSPVPVPS
jgi:hypothetical protein